MSKRSLPVKGSNQEQQKYTPKPKLPTQAIRSSIITPSYHNSNSNSTQSVNTIANLSASEKEKVSRLVQKLVTLGTEHEAALMALKEEKSAFAGGAARLQEVMEDQLAVITEKLRSKDEEIAELETRNSLSAGLLALYQAKLKNSSDMFRFYELNDNESRIKITQLESDLQSMQSLVASQKNAIASFELSRALQSTSLRELQGQHDASSRQLQLEMQDTRDKLALREAQLAELRQLVTLQSSQIEMMRRDSRSALVSSAADMSSAQVPVYVDKGPISETVGWQIRAGSIREDVPSSAPTTLPPTPIASAYSTPISPTQPAPTTSPIEKPSREDATIGASSEGYDNFSALYASVLSDASAGDSRFGSQPHEEQRQHYFQQTEDSSALDTSAISFSSSHHGNHSEAGDDSAVLLHTDAVDRGGSLGAAGSVSAATDANHALPSSRHHTTVLNQEYSGSANSFVSEKTRTALDPTPMKRKISKNTAASIASYDVDVELSTATNTISNSVVQSVDRHPSSLATPRLKSSATEPAAAPVSILRTARSEEAPSSRGHAAAAGPGRRQLESSRISESSGPLRSQDDTKVPKEKLSNKSKHHQVNASLDSAVSVLSEHGAGPGPHSESKRSAHRTRSPKQLSVSKKVKGGEAKVIRRSADHTAAAAAVSVSSQYKQSGDKPRKSRAASTDPSSPVHARHHTFNAAPLDLLLTSPSTARSVLSQLNSSGSAASPASGHVQPLSPPFDDASLRRSASTVGKSQISSSSTRPSDAHNTNTRSARARSASGQRVASKAAAPDRSQPMQYDDSLFSMLSEMEIS